MSWLVTNAIAAFLLPPLNLLLVAIAGVLLWKKYPKLARFLVACSLIFLWLLSTPLVAEAGLHLLEAQTRIADPGKQNADAIVVLGGGTYFAAPEYGTDTVQEDTLIRLRYAAYLYRATGIPILVTGGMPAGNALSEAQQMKAVLEQDFKVPVAWTEDESDNTRQNALYSHALLQKSGIRRIYLVTHAWHMPRASRAFSQAGFEVIEAPTAFTTRFRYDLLALLPNAKALRDSRIFLHEAIGLVWYKIKSS